MILECEVQAGASKLDLLKSKELHFGMVIGLSCIQSHCPHTAVEQVVIQSKLLYSLPLSCFCYLLLLQVSILFMICLCLNRSSALSRYFHHAIVFDFRPLFDVIYPGSSWYYFIIKTCIFSF